MAMLPTLCAVLGLWPESDRLDGSRREDILPVAKAASQAAREAGTEVTGARAPWALLKHRRRRRLPAPTETEPARPTRTRTRRTATRRGFRAGSTRQATGLSKRLEKSPASHGLPGDPGDTPG
ncbi:hypothetical protein STANM309S_00772 [Streptomyces tanashiensis]